MYDMIRYDTIRYDTMWLLRQSSVQYRMLIGALRWNGTLHLAIKNMYI
jgi:hypothetical protein